MVFWSAVISKLYLQLDVVNVIAFIGFNHHSPNLKRR